MNITSFNSDLNKQGLEVFKDGNIMSLTNVFEQYIRNLSK